MKKDELSLRRSLLRAFSLLFITIWSLTAHRSPAQLFTNLQSLVHQLPVNNLATVADGPKGIGSADFDGDGQADFTVYDRVGNKASASEQGYDLKYKHEEQNLLIRASTTAWYSVGWPMYQDNDGVLWFSDKISGSAVGWLEVTAVSLYGGGVKNISFSKETGFEGPSNPFDTWGPGYSTASSDTSYTFHGNSTTDGAITVTAMDHSSNTVTKDFAVRRDVSPPVITILAPTPQLV